MAAKLLIWLYFLGRFTSDASAPDRDQHQTTVLMTYLIQ